MMYQLIPVSLPQMLRSGNRHSHPPPAALQNSLVSSVKVWGDSQLLEGCALHWVPYLSQGIISHVIPGGFTLTRPPWDRCLYVHFTAGKIKTDRITDLLGFTAILDSNLTSEPLNLHTKLPPTLLCILFLTGKVWDSDILWFDGDIILVSYTVARLVPWMKWSRSVVSDSLRPHGL